MPAIYHNSVRDRFMGAPDEMLSINNSILGFTQQADLPPRKGFVQLPKTAEVPETVYLTEDRLWLDA